jgi:hypothetical protein
LPERARGSLTLSYLGTAGVAELGRRSRERAAADLPPLVHAALPAFRDEGGRIVAVPHLRDPDMPHYPRLRFYPATPLTRAVFTVV